MIQLYQARDRIEAQLLKDYLLFHGVECVVLGDFLSGAAGELPAVQFPTIWLVDDVDEARARQLLDQYQQRAQADGQQAWDCPVCGEHSEGNFDICWNCGAERASS
jgi:hypothetical protein